MHSPVQAEPFASAPLLEWRHFHLSPFSHTPAFRKSIPDADRMVRNHKQKRICTFASTRWATRMSRKWGNSLTKLPQSWRPRSGTGPNIPATPSSLPKTRCPPAPHHCRRKRGVNTSMRFHPVVALFDSLIRFWRSGSVERRVSSTTFDRLGSRSILLPAAKRMASPNSPLQGGDKPNLRNLLEGFVRLRTISNFIDQYGVWYEVGIYLGMSTISLETIRSFCL